MTYFDTVLASRQFRTLLKLIFGQYGPCWGSGNSWKDNEVSEWFRVGYESQLNNF